MRVSTIISTKLNQVPHLQHAKPHAMRGRPIIGDQLFQLIFFYSMNHKNCKLYEPFYRLWGSWLSNPHCICATSHYPVEAFCCAWSAFQHSPWEHWTLHRLGPLLLKLDYDERQLNMKRMKNHIVSKCKEIPCKNL